MNNVNYRVLKSNIIKACTQVKGMDFLVDYDKMKELAAEINLVPICTNMKAGKVIPEQIPYLSEYFEKTHLSWFSGGKFSTVITFVDSEDIDDECQELLDEMETSTVDDPDIDKVHVYATLVANYHCYFATIVSYQNNDPNRVGKPSYEIVCRANKVVIKDSDYQYNPKDFS